MTSEPRPQILYLERPERYGYRQVDLQRTWGPDEERIVLQMQEARTREP